MSDDPETNVKQSIMIFGRNAAKIPCFKYSWIYGITSGFGAGLLTFMFTSRPPLATHVGVGAMLTVSLTYFGFCRVEFAKAQYASVQIKELIREYNDPRGVK